MRAIESTRKKFYASEEKCSWSPVLLKWWHHHQKQGHQKQVHHKQNQQKLKIIRRWKNQSFKGCSKVLITPSIAEDQKSKATIISNKFEGIGCLFFEEWWQSTIVWSVQPLSPLLSLCLCYRTRKIALPATMFLYTGNGFEIDPS